MLKKIILAAAVASSFGVAMADTAIVVREAPPPMRVERAPGARPGWEWAPGHWDWRHGQYVWVQGHWMRERHGEHWVADNWVQREGRWERMPGHWEHGAREMGGPGWRDRDHDHAGVRDRDHDGVPNRYDAHPDNPYRR